MASLPPPSTHPELSSRRHAVKACKAFVIQWLSLNWPDLVCMAAVGGLAAGIYHAPIPVTRTFPVTFSHSGDIVYPEWAYPSRGWILSPIMAGGISIGTPMVVFAATQLRLRSIRDATAAVLGTVWAVLLSTLAQVALKQLVGGFRPYFLDACMPDPALAAARNGSGLDGVGFRRVMYTTNICTQPDRSKIDVAVTSFPSGHAAVAFAGLGFLFLWLNAKLKVWADQRPACWKMALALLPLLGALIMAGILTVDAAHNWYDIVAGAVIGAAMALAAYRASYAAVWDWRFNHLALQPREAFPYDHEEPDLSWCTLTRTAGWGRRKSQPPRVKTAGAMGAGFDTEAEADDAPPQTRPKTTATVGREMA